MNTPQHVAIIMDGNGRWAKKRLLPRIAGHRAGVEAVRRVARAAQDVGLECLTLYAFSSENWKRPATEVSDLMGLLRHFIQSDIDEFHANGVRLRVIGNYKALEPGLVELIESAMARTAANTGPVIAIALNYGAQDEMVRAAQRLAERVASATMLISSHRLDEVAALATASGDLVRIERTGAVTRFPIGARAALTSGLPSPSPTTSRDQSRSSNVSSAAPSTRYEASLSPGRIIATATY